MTNVLAMPEMSKSADWVIGKNVKFLLVIRDDSQAALANELGISPQSMSQKLRGRRAWAANEIEGAARHFHVTIDSLFKLPDLDSNQEPPRSWLAPVSQLETHRASKISAHSAVHSDRDATSGSAA